MESLKTVSKEDDKIIKKQNSENIFHGTYPEDYNQLTESRTFVEKHRASHIEAQSSFIKVFFPLIY